MAYFSRFPLMVYDVAGNENYKLLPDILKRVKLRSGLRSGSFLFDAYDVIDGERPEDIAFSCGVSGLTHPSPELHLLCEAQDRHNGLMGE